MERTPDLGENCSRLLCQGAATATGFFDLTERFAKWLHSWIIVLRILPCEHATKLRTR